MTQGIKNLEPEPTDRTIASYMDHASLGSFQKSMIALAALAVLFDGFDQQAISFTIPSIMREFGVERAAFAPVVALGLTGMTIGSACAGIIGDRIGRRFTIIVTMLIFGILTSLTAMVHTVPQLATMRFLAGLGLGGVLPSAAAYAAEFSSLRHRASVVTIAIVCIPLGGMLGGVVAGSVLPALGWRAFYIIAGAAPVVYAFILMISMPETPRFLVARGHRDGEVAALLRRMGHEVAPGSRFGADDNKTAVHRGDFRALFQPGLKRETFALFCLFFASLISVNMVFSWLPTLLHDAGYGTADASYGLSLFNLGGVAGALAGAFLISQMGSRWAMILLALLGVGSGALLSLWFSEPGRHGAVMAILAVAGFAINGVQTNCFALAAHIYSVRVRATGVGSAVAFGRVGAILASFVGAATLTYAHGLLYFPIVSVVLAFTIVPLLIIRRHIPRSSAKEPEPA